MTAPRATATTVPSPVPNGSAPSAVPNGSAPSAVPNGSGPSAAAAGSAPSPRASTTSQGGQMHTRISGIRTGLIAGAVALVVVMIFIIQNTRAVDVSFLGAHLRLSLAVALLFAAIAGALLMTVAGTARITQLRRIVRRNRASEKVG